MDMFSDRTVSFVSSYATTLPDKHQSTEAPKSVSKLESPWVEPFAFQNATELQNAIKQAEREAERLNRRYENDFVWDLILDRIRSHSEHGS